ncbi:unnamed protein product [Dovyalis caffra]|uniref:Uncharacterized protein n=1 Tax=Dovyalis caffra TaxID=77055 RepID=A0AAV1SL79_9ROSI|nr:unnamed protein product [Dovyalis caffra]
MAPITKYKLPYKLVTEFAILATKFASSLTGIVETTVGGDDRFCGLPVGCRVEALKNGSG